MKKKTTPRVISKLKKTVEKKGMGHVLQGLNYRSATTVYNWFRKNEVPARSIKTVKSFLEQESANAK